MRACFDYETEIIAFTDHMPGLLHRQGTVQGHRLLARTGASPCGELGKAEQTYSVEQEAADAGGGQGKTAQLKDGKNTWSCSPLVLSFPRGYNHFHG
jgi:hypothetical protein